MASKTMRSPLGPRRQKAADTANNVILAAGAIFVKGKRICGE